MKSPRHLAVFCHNYPPHPGGLEVMVQTVARGLARRHRVTLVTSGWGGERGVAQEEGVEVHRLPAVHVSEGWSVPYPVPWGPGAVRAMRRVAGADLFWAHGALYVHTVTAALLARRRRRPLVLTEHVGWVPYQSRLIRAIQRVAWALPGRFTLASAAAATTYNERVVGWLEGRRPALPVTYIGNGVDLAAFRPRPAERLALRRRLGLPEDELLVLFVGRASVKKNLEALLALPRHGYQLVVCGGARRLPEDVINRGLVPHAEMPDLYAAADLMVLPSVGEGFPLAMQEALAAGLPLVLLWDEGYRRWLDPEVVAPCRQLAELGERLEALVADTDRRAELARQARRWAEERWSWEATVERYEELFEGLLVGRNGGSSESAFPPGEER